MDVDDEVFCSILRLNGALTVGDESSISNILCREALWHGIEEDSGASLQGHGKPDKVVGASGSETIEDQPADIKTEPDGSFEREMTKEEEDDVYARAAKARQNPTGAIGTSYVSDYVAAQQRAAAAAAGRKTQTVKRKPDVKDPNKPKGKKVKSEPLTFRYV